MMKQLVMNGLVWSLVSSSWTMFTAHKRKSLSSQFLHPGPRKMIRLDFESQNEDSKRVREKLVKLKLLDSKLRLAQWRMDWARTRLNSKKILFGTANRKFRRYQQIKWEQMRSVVMQSWETKWNTMDVDLLYLSTQHDQVALEEALKKRMLVVLSQTVFGYFFQTILKFLQIVGIVLNTEHLCCTTK